jgi:hypothetical protein
METTFAINATNATPDLNCRDNDNIGSIKQAAIVWGLLVHVTKRHQPHEGLQLSRLERVKMQ